MEKNFNRCPFCCAANKEIEDISFCGKPVEPFMCFQTLPEQE